jgi:hypothetical protein
MSDIHDYTTTTTTPLEPFYASLSSNLRVTPSGIFLGSLCAAPGGASHQQTSQQSAASIEQWQQQSTKTPTTGGTMRLCGAADDQSFSLESARGGGPQIVARLARHVELDGCDGLDFDPWGRTAAAAINHGCGIVPRGPVSTASTFPEQKSPGPSITAQAALIALVGSANSTAERPSRAAWQDPAPPSAYHSTAPVVSSQEPPVHECSLVVIVNAEDSWWGGLDE